MLTGDRFSWRRYEMETFMENMLLLTLFAVTTLVTFGLDIYQKRRKRG